jgi:hypothetical protein
MSDFTVIVKVATQMVSDARLKPTFCLIKYHKINLMLESSYDIEHNFIFYQTKTKAEATNTQYRKWTAKA